MSHDHFYYYSLGLLLLPTYHPTSILTSPFPSVCDQSKLLRLLDDVNDDDEKKWYCTEFFLDGNRTQECPCYNTVSRADAEANFKCLLSATEVQTLFQDWERCTITGNSLAPIVTIPDNHS